MIFTDPVFPVYDLLTRNVQGNPMYGLTGNRVWSPIPHTSFDNSQKAITFHLESSLAHPKAVLLEGVFVFKAYGGTANPSDARVLSETLRRYLNGIRNVPVSTGEIISADFIQGFDGGADPDTGWYYAVSKYGIRIS